MVFHITTFPLNIQRKTEVEAKQERQIKIGKKEEERKTKEDLEYCGSIKQLKIK